MKFLYVDGEGLSRRLAERVMASAGMEFESADSLGGAEEALAGGGFQMVLSALPAPGDGLALLELMRGMEEWTPVACVRGEGAADAAREADFDWVFERPFDRARCQEAMGLAAELARPWAS